MPRYYLTNRARADIRDIARFTRARRGIEQRARYLNALGERFQSIAENPATGRRREELASGYRSALCGRHIAIYRQVDGGIEIVRVLHVSMDVADRIKEDK